MMGAKLGKIAESAGAMGKYVSLIKTNNRLFRKKRCQTVHFFV